MFCLYVYNFHFFGFILHLSLIILYSVNPFRSSTKLWRYHWTNRIINTSYQLLLSFFFIRNTVLLDSIQKCQCYISIKERVIQRENSNTKEQQTAKATIESYKQREIPAPGGGFQLALKTNIYICTVNTDITLNSISS